MSSTEDGPRAGHLGTAWEIALVSTFTILIFLIIGTVLFQIHRKQKRQREAEMLDIESGVSSEPPLGKNSTPPPKTRSVPSSKSKSKRHSKSSSSSSHNSKKPPRYYWNHR